MRIQGDYLPTGQLIVAVVQRGEDVCAFAGGGCVVLPCGLIKLEDVPALEVLTPMLQPPRAQA